MISLKMALVSAVAFAGGAFFVSPVPQAIAAIIATDVQCTGCVGTPDLAGNAVTAAKIKDGEVKSADIGFAAVTNDDIALDTIDSFMIKNNALLAVDLAPDSVGASELQGVSKLIFAKCIPFYNIKPGEIQGRDCSVPGVAAGDFVVVTANSGITCLIPTLAHSFAGGITVNVKNTCNLIYNGGQNMSVIVFQK